MTASAELGARLRATLREVPDFPRTGIVFKDITPVLGDAALFAAVVDAMTDAATTEGITHVAGIAAAALIEEAGEVIAACSFLLAIDALEGAQLITDRYGNAIARTPVPRSAPAVT